MSFSQTLMRCSKAQVAEEDALAFNTLFGRNWHVWLPLSQLAVHQRGKCFFDASLTSLRLQSHTAYAWKKECQGQVLALRCDCLTAKVLVRPRCQVP